ncbi:hypothetical protein F4779DRAFT_622703 [Xylariaceae sp. FL0662B]|nr:hypothetical protein F4779DRAFT_622703 [Xylariaceae sp. FL0662B]
MTQYLPGLRRSLERSQHDKWGFLIYRTTYASDELWTRYLAHLETEIQEALDFYEQHVDVQAAIRPGQRWTVVEDPATLGAASKADVRVRFRDWVAGRSVARDGPGADYAFLEQLVPRYRFCLMVDAACLESFERGVRSGGGDGGAANGAKPYILLIDAQFEDGGDHSGQPAGDDQREGLDEDEDEDVVAEEYPEVEGCTDRDVGWMFVDTGAIFDLYDEAAGRKEWRYVYCRPPSVYV